MLKYELSQVYWAGLIGIPRMNSRSRSGRVQELFEPLSAALRSQSDPHHGFTTLETRSQGSRSLIFRYTLMRFP